MCVAVRAAGSFLKDVLEQLLLTAHVFLKRERRAQCVLDLALLHNLLMPCVLPHLYQAIRRCHYGETGKGTKPGSSNRPVCVGQCDLTATQ